MKEASTHSCTLCEAERLQRLADWREEMGDYDLAASWLRRSIALQTLAQNADPFQLADSMYNLGLLYLAQEDHVNAERYLLKALWRQRELLGDAHQDTLETIAALQQVCCAQDEYAFIEAPYVREIGKTDGTATPTFDRRTRRTSTAVAS